MKFEDHFSQQAQKYAECRPCYPDDLYRYLASIAPGRRLAWDCGTGNGQAAVELARYFDRVVASDASAEQIAHAFPHARIDYRIEQAEDISLGAESVDLVTVAQAVHWFDLAQFYRQVRHVLVPGGILAVWTYHAAAIQPDVDRLLSQYECEILAGYWPERIQHVRDHYAKLPFPWDEVEVPPFEMAADWSLWQLVCFLDSWSGTRRYQAAQGYHPINIIWEELLAAWGDPETSHPIRWPLYLRAGKRP